MYNANLVIYMSLQGSWGPGLKQELALLNLVPTSFDMCIKILGFNGLKYAHF
jgi:hypothetical protein